jgi:hypothetical protein
VLDFGGETLEPEDAEVAVRLARARRARVSLRFAVQRALAPSFPWRLSLSPSSPPVVFVFVSFVSLLFVFFFFFFFLLLLLLRLWPSLFIIIIFLFGLFTPRILGGPVDLIVSVQSGRLVLLVGELNAATLVRAARAVRLCGG